MPCPNGACAALPGTAAAPEKEATIAPHTKPEGRGNKTDIEHVRMPASGSQIVEYMLNITCKRIKPRTMPAAARSTENMSQLCAVEYTNMRSGPQQTNAVRCASIRDVILGDSEPQACAAGRDRESKPAPRRFNGQWRLRNDQQVESIGAGKQADSRSARLKRKIRAPA